MITPKIPMGRLIMKMERQPKTLVSQPPKVGPKAGPMMTPMPQYPRALPRSLGGKTSEIMVMPTGVSAPPPRACSTRAKMSTGRFHATPQSSDPTVKIPRDATYRFLVPMRSRIHEVRGIRVAKASI